MKKKKKTGTRGFTLIELILAVALISIVIVLSSNILIFGINSQKLTAKEYSFQSDLRRATEQTNELIRYSKAVFAVPRPFVSTESAMDPGWNYLMVSPDGKRVVIMEYDDVLEKHVEKIMVDESDGIVYGLSLEKDVSANGDKILKYKINAYNTDEDGNKTNSKLLYETTIETANAIQVVDKGTESSPSMALAFRSDGQTSGKGKNQIAYITIIVDTSSSMNNTPSGGGSTDKETRDSRIAKVRNALIGEGSEKGIIQLFSNEENVFISFVPFANTANYPSPHANSIPAGQHPIYEVYKDIDENSLLSLISTTKADGYDTRKYGSSQGGTNTGDGLRRAYFLHETFRARMSAMGSPISDKDQVHHYMILLVDGETTFETAVYTYKDNGFYIDANKPETIGGKTYKRFNWNTDWTSSFKSDYKLDGNIYLDRLSSYTPPSDTLILNKKYNGTINYKSSGWFGWSNQSYTGNIVEYGKKNDDIDKTVITGNGRSTINNSSYINTIGSMIQGFEDSAGIRSYLIGYADGLTTNINYIGNKIGTETTSRYVYNSKDFNLDEIFKNIATDIMADFWLAAGPQIIK